MKITAPFLLAIATLAAAPTFASNDVAVGNMRSAATENGLYRVQAELNNRSEQTRQVYYRFRWLDQNGFAAWEEEAWKPLTVYGNQRLLVNTVSPIASAQSYSLEIFEQP